MSFSKDIKEEILNTKIEKTCCASHFLALYLVLKTGNLVNEDKSLVFTFTSAKDARFFLQFIKQELKYEANVDIINSRDCRLRFYPDEEFLFVLRDISTSKDFKKINKCCKNFLLKAFFLAAGYVSNPVRSYNMEFVLSSAGIRDFFKLILNSFRIVYTERIRSSKHVIYIKKIEEIIKVLNIINAVNSQLKLEEIRIMRETKDNVQRVVNCEVANLERTAKASVRHINSINYIKRKKGFNCLSQDLSEVAKLRIRFKDASLSQIGEKMHPVVNKSYISRKLDMLDKIAENIRKNEKKK